MFYTKRHTVFIFKTLLQ